MRWFIEGTDYNMVHQSQRIHSEDLAYLSTISPERLEALDMLPVSLFRVNYRSLDAKDTGCGKLESEAFRETVYRIAMLTEIQNFALRHQLHPLVAIGFDEDGYSRFSNADFLQRQAYVYRGEFTIQSRVRIKKLNLDPTDKIALLQDTCAILLAEFRYLKANKPEHLGRKRSMNSIFNRDKGPPMLCSRFLSGARHHDATRRQGRKSLSVPQARRLPEIHRR
ncbi:hypothetical protein, partial [Azotobacter chroococcum]|uniref:hypothetical protein n=1 Tax=Azotobacter chroococcum TaxID=353 RepID=UPI00146C2702